MKLRNNKRFLRAQQVDRLNFDEHFSKIPYDSPSENLEFIKQGIEDGSFKYLKFQDEIGVVKGEAVIAFDSFPEGLELWVVTVVSKDNSQEIRNEIEDCLEKLAKSNGCKTMRFSTIRNGLVKAGCDRGWFLSEFVMRKEV